MGLIWRFIRFKQTAKAALELIKQRTADVRAALGSAAGSVLFYSRNFFLRGSPLDVRAGDARFRMVPAGQTAMNLWRDPAHQCEELQCLMRLLKPDSVFVSVGSSAGLHALAAAAAVPRGKVYVFEPRPEVFGVLKKNVRLNGADSIVLVNALPAEPEGGAPAGRFGSFRAKAAKPIDEFVMLNGIERVDILRVAAEGAERAVLRGAGKLLSRPDAPAVMYETSFATRAYGYHPVEIMWYLEKLGYEIFVPHPEDGRLLVHKPEYGYTGTKVALKSGNGSPVLPEGIFR